MKPFGWYDHFNDVLYRNEADAKQAANGGNKITPLFEARSTECSECPQGKCSDCPRLPARWNTA